MPRFFFDIAGGGGDTTDTTGQDFPDARAAFAAAAQVLSEVAREVKLDGYSAQYSCIVKDSVGAKIFRSTLIISGEALTPGCCINPPDGGRNESGGGGMP